jgi:hypothetical protein
VSRSRTNAVGLRGLTVDENEPVEVVVYWLACAEREFDDTYSEF